MRRDLEWRQPAPFWPPTFESVSDRERAVRPSVLRFIDERFMDDLRSELAEDPSLVVSREVPLKETWRDAMAPRPPAFDDRRAEPAKLYQPTHGRFYLVAGCLVCRTFGLPDHRVKLDRGDKVSFVLRRLRRDSTGNYREQAWLTNDGTGVWRDVEDARALLDTNGREERFPLFPMNYPEKERVRTLHVGFLPTSSRETFHAAPEVAGTIPPSEPLADQRRELFEIRVSTALSLLRSQYALSNADAHAEAKEALFFVLVDFADILETHFPEVWAGLEAGVMPPGLSSSLATLTNVLLTTDFTSGVKWSYAMVRARALEPQITAGTLTPETNELTGGLSRIGIRAVIDTYQASSIATAFEAALAASSPPPLSMLSTPAPKVDPSAEAVYAVRFVYERPQCQGIEPPVVSKRSRSFLLASYFDADAPVRPLIVNLPIDTTISGLRRFPRAVNFVISNKLREQMNRVRNQKLGDLDDGNLGPSTGIDLGMICSFSIPIVTIVALLLLMIIVYLLNIIFWWVPFLFVCLPLKLEAKNS